VEESDQGGRQEGAARIPPGVHSEADTVDHQVVELAQHLATLGHPEVPQARLEYLIRCKSSDGDVKKAFAILKLFDDSVAGILRENNPSVRMLGAENREKTTCYLDSLLFAMFSHVEIFEAVLYNTFQDEPRKRLVTSLRLWVNMLRTGKLVTTDIVRLPLVTHVKALTRAVDSAAAGLSGGVWLAGCGAQATAGRLGSVWIHHRQVGDASGDFEDRHLPRWKGGHKG